MIGLYPAAGEDGVVVPETMAAILLRRLGAPGTGDAGAGSYERSGNGGCGFG